MRFTGIDYRYRSLHDKIVAAVDVLSLSIFLGTLTHEWQKSVAHGGITVLIAKEGVIGCWVLQSTWRQVLFSVAVTAGLEIYCNFH